jgi:UDP-N-acetylmuramoylalanine--D-glutamate ligase
VHNLQNIAAAAQACGVVGITEQLIKSAVSSFTGVEQRLQTVSEKNGVKYVNDSASTNPDSTIAAIKSFSRPLILIMGGSDKNLDYNELAKNIKSADNIKAVVVIGELTPKLVNLLNGFRGQILTGAKTMSEIIAQTDSVANAGDTVLLSPAAASFDMFKNSKDRGQQFNATVK